MAGSKKDKKAKRREARAKSTDSARVEQRGKYVKLPKGKK